MTESRTYLLNNVDIQIVIDELSRFLHTEKGMDVQTAPTPDGYLLQAGQPKDTLRTLSGMRLATTVQFSIVENNLNVTIGEGQWSDKLGAGAVGLFLLWPLAITAGIGAYKQKNLPDEIFHVIGCILQPAAQNMGAGRADRARQTLRYAILLCVSYGALSVLVMQLAAEPFVGLFTADTEVIRLGGQYMRGYIWDCILAGIHFCFSGYFCAC